MGRCLILLATLGVHDKIDPMRIALFVMRALELLFFTGLAGAAVVVLISFFHDAKELLNGD